MQAGILLPRSKAHPLIGTDFFEGMKAYLQFSGTQEDIKINADTIGFGGTEKEVYAKTEKILLLDDADILVAYMDERVLELVMPLLQASGKPVLLVHPGANHPLNWIPQPNLLRLGLQHAFLCGLIGMDAAASEPGASGAMVSSFYDCGYLHYTAMVREFNAGKGTVTHHYINNQHYDASFSIEPLTGFLAANPGTRNLLCILDELPAALFYSLLRNDEKASGLRLFVSPMMLEQKAFEKTGTGLPFAISGYLPWHRDVPTAANKTFTGYYQESRNKNPGQFSLLGWECGMILEQVLKNCSDSRNGEAVVRQLGATTLETPRGTLELDTETQVFLAPFIKCTVPPGTTGMHMQFDCKPGNQWEDFSSTAVTGPVSGWTNTYLCY